MRVLKVVCYVLVLHNKILPGCRVGIYLVFLRVSCVGSFIFVVVEFSLKLYDNYINVVFIHVDFYMIINIFTYVLSIYVLYVKGSPVVVVLST
jgi:hypothetical protein